MCLILPPAPSVLQEGSSDACVYTGESVCREALRSNGHLGSHEHRSPEAAGKGIGVHFLASLSRRRCGLEVRNMGNSRLRDLGDNVLCHSLFELASPRRVLGALGRQAGSTPSEAADLVNTCRLLVPIRMSRSGLLPVSRRLCATTARRGERHVRDGQLETALLFDR